MLTSSESEAVKTEIARVLAAPTQLIWEKRLTETFWINSVAISRDGSRVIAGTFVHDYRQKSDKLVPNVRARFGTYGFTSSSATPIWTDEFLGWDGVFGVAVSADGTVAAAAGWLDRTESMGQGFVRAYDAADGTKLLDFSNVKHRVSWASLSADGNVLTAVADDVYVFFREGAAFNPIPVKLGISGTASEWVTNVAVHPSGTWLAACDHSGHVYLATLADEGAVTKVWNANATIPFLSVAMAAEANTFVVGGGNDVFLFERDTFETEAPIRYDTTNGEDPATIPPNKPDGSPQENVRWVATSADGTLVTAVANRRKGDNKTGVVLALRPAKSALTQIWRQSLPRNPNSTSVDTAGTLVTVADGYPTITPAAFSLFDAKDGRKMWDFPTFSMNWPMAICANGTAIAAGSDDGSVYYFKP